MEHIFYAFAIFAILYEVVNLFNPNRLQEFKRIVSDMSKGEAISDRDNVRFYSIGCSTYMYAVWNIVGLFSSQWVFFLALLGLGIITATVKKAIPSGYVLFTIIDALLSVGLLGVIIINKYHISLI
jgi:hypothetical protein